MYVGALQRFARLGIAGFAIACLILDCLHIHQIRRAWKNVHLLPYQYQDMAIKGQLEVYFGLLLLTPDILAILMYAILILGIRPCTDTLYHFINRVLWGLLLCVIGGWYPILEILRIRDHTNTLQELHGCNSKTPSFESAYFCFSGYPNDYQLVYATGFNYLETQNKDAAEWSYSWLGKNTVPCGVYRTRNCLMLVLLVPLVVAELRFGFLCGELTEGKARVEDDFVEADE